MISQFLIHCHFPYVHKHKFPLLPTETRITKAVVRDKLMATNAPTAPRKIGQFRDARVAAMAICNLIYPERNEVCIHSTHSPILTDNNCTTYIPYINSLLREPETQEIQNLDLKRPSHVFLECSKREMFKLYKQQFKTPGTWVS